jgi:hypothetical protein
MDDKDKSVIEKLVDTVRSTVGSVVEAAVMPTRDNEAEALAENANEQMLLGDAAIAPEAVPAPTASTKIGKRTDARPLSKKSVKGQQPTKTLAKRAKKSARKKKKSTKTAKAAKKTIKKMKKAKKGKKKSGR